MLVCAMRGLVGALAIVAGLPTVRADEPLPFSDAELETALRLRVAARHQVDVAAGRDAIVVTVDGQVARVVLGDERGADAARLVALVAAGLVLDEPEPAAPTSIDRVAGPAVAARSRHRWSLGARAVAPIGLRAPVGLGIVGSIEGGARWRWSVAIGGELQSVGLGESTELRVIGVPIRGGLGVGDRAAIGASLVAVPLFASAGDGATSVVLGGGVHGRAVIDGPAAIPLTLAIGVDVMANQIAYHWDGAEVMITGRFRPWLALAATWETP